MSTTLRIVTVAVGRAIGALLVGLVAGWLVVMSTSHHHSHVDCRDHRLSIGSALCAGTQLPVLGRRSRPSRAGVQIAVRGAAKPRATGHQMTSGHKLSKSAEVTRPTSHLTMALTLGAS
jgi:hypothetical protein